MAAAAVASTVIGGASAIKQGAAQRKAQRAQQKAALVAKDQQKRANAAANMQQPDTASFISRAREMSKTGFAGTLLSGAKGVNPAALAPLVGRASLLGG